MNLQEAVAAAMSEFHGQLLDVSMYASGETEIGFQGYLAGSHALEDEADGALLEFTGPEGQPLGAVVLTEGAFEGAEWRKIETPGSDAPLLAIELDDREIWLSHP